MTSVSSRPVTTFTNLSHSTCHRYQTFESNISQLISLTHWGRRTHICVSEITIIDSDNGLYVAWPAPTHYLNQCWNIVNSNIRNKLQCNLKRNSCIFIRENAFENVVCEKASILSRPQCVKTIRNLNLALVPITGALVKTKEFVSKWESPHKEPATRKNFPFDDVIV